MSDEAIAEQPKKRRGRPAKVKRHDPDEAPIDGNEGVDRVFNKDPDFVYFLAEQSEDVSKILNRGGEVCLRGENSPRPYYDNRRNAGEAEIKVKDLVLMREPRESFEKRQKTHLATAHQRMKALNVQATQKVGAGLSSINTNFADGGYHRQVI